MTTTTPITVSDVTDFLLRFAPLSLAESWDNVGLLVGDPSAPVTRILTCLTLTEDVAREAVSIGANLIVSHHPVLFRATKRLTTETPEGRTLLTLIANNVAVYSPHTAFDSAAEGINRRLATQLGVADPKPLRPAASDPSGDTGGGRYGELEEGIPLEALLPRIRQALRQDVLGYVGDLSRPVHRIAVACGAAAEFMDDAIKANCQVLITGEARFHACLEARDRGIALVIAGHYSTERPAVEELAERLQQEFRTLTVEASQLEHDPLKWSLP